MGNTCASVKKSSKESKERKESAESIPYGQSSPAKATETTNITGGGGGDESSEKQPQYRHQPTPTATTTVSGSEYCSALPVNTANEESAANAPSLDTQSMRPESQTIMAPSPDPVSLSPVPPPTSASTPSPYSSIRYSSGRDGCGGHQSYQNISPIQGHLSLADFPDTTRAGSFAQLFHLRSDLAPDSSGDHLEDYYVIALSTESDEVCVWDIYRQRPARTVKGIPRPRHVRMVDHFRTVVLCNRELMLYDLNRGTLITKLKGVMNQKMPYYGLHDSKYVVALSRNRMYVNVINLETGDLETTFKAGEDRFLNSLLTSANGKICVCGDETQKPFPLLVWDLSNRKLLYDLRIPHHEFLTQLSAISDDGHYVVSVCKECSNNSSTNFLIVYDLQSGTLFKKWKPEHDSVSVAISTQCGGCVMNGMKNHDVLVWDLSTGNIKYTLSGHTAPPDMLNPAPKSNVFLSYNSSRLDKQLRIWSLENGQCLWTFTPENDLSCCTLTPNGMAIIFGVVGQKRLQLAVRPDSGADYIREMAGNTPSYGSPDLDGQTIDLNNNDTG